MSSLTVSELRSELADRGLPTTGLKKVLFARLQAYEESLDDDDAMSNDGSDGSDHGDSDEGTYGTASYGELRNGDGGNGNAGIAPAATKGGLHAAALRVMSMLKEPKEDEDEAISGGLLLRGFLFFATLATVSLTAVDSVVDLVYDGDMRISATTMIILATASVGVADHLFGFGIDQAFIARFKSKAGTKTIGLAMYIQTTLFLLVTFSSFLRPMNMFFAGKCLNLAILAKILHKALTEVDIKWLYEYGNYWINSSRYYFATMYFNCVFICLIAMRESSYLPTKTRFFIMDLNTRFNLAQTVCVVVFGGTFVQMMIAKITKQKEPMTPKWMVNCIIFISLAMIYNVHYYSSANTRFCPLRHAESVVPIEGSSNVVNDLKLLSLNDQITKQAKDAVTEASFQGSEPARQVDFRHSFGCLKATFTVASQLSPHMRRGLFSEEGRKFPAWLRFSDGGGERRAGSSFTDGDMAETVKGLALKVMGVGGDRTKRTMSKDAPGAEEATQDFIFSSSSTYPTDDPTHVASSCPLGGGVGGRSSFHFSRPSRDLDQGNGIFGYLLSMFDFIPGLEFLHNDYSIGGRVKEGDGFGPQLSSKIAWIMQGWSDIVPRLGVVRRAAENVAGMRDILDLFDTEYHSGTPSILGAPDEPACETSFNRHPCRQAVKYALKPCRGWAVNETEMREIHNAGIDSNLNFRGRLREVMKARLGSGKGVCFEFFVHSQGTNACDNRIDDPSKEWLGTGVPANRMSKLGEVNIPAQQFTGGAQMEFCNHGLNFNPFQGLKVHAPMGEINFLRKKAYAASAHQRRTLQKAYSKEYFNANTQWVPPGEPAADFSDVQSDSSTARECGAGERSMDGGRCVAQGRAGQVQPQGNTQAYEFARYPAPFQHLPKKVKNYNMVSPANADYPRYARVAQYGMAMTDMIKAKRATMGKQRSEFTEPDDFRRYLGHTGGTGGFFGASQNSEIPEPEIARDWKEDAAFARQFINGVNPLILSKVTSMAGIPATFQTQMGNDATLLPRMTSTADGAELQALVDAGRLFLCDYEILQGIPAQAGTIMYSPVVLLFMTAATDPNAMHQGRRLMPLAIQLTRYTHRANRVYTPVPLAPATQASKVWLFAKMHAAGSDGQIHQMVSHLCFTHLAMEPLIVAVHRWFPKTHLMHKILTPHFTDTLAINSLGRVTLLPPGGSFDKAMAPGVRGGLALMAKAYVQGFQQNITMHPFRELSARGFKPIALEDRGTAKDPMPAYYYRDDALDVFEAIRAYVGQVVAKEYKAKGGDKGVAGDALLQAFRRDLAAPSGGNTPGVPVMDTESELAEFIATVLFTATAQHAAVNFGQFEYFSFIPNKPLIMLHEMPEDESIVTDQYIVDGLANNDVVENSIQIGRFLAMLDIARLDPALGEVQNDNAGLGAMDMPGYPFPGIGYIDEYSAMIKDLEVLQRIKEERNKKEHNNYHFLMPREIPLSINI